jgi:hypothetical protein
VKKKPGNVAENKNQESESPAPIKKNRGLMGKDFSRKPVLKAAEDFIDIDDIPTRENYTAKRQQAILDFITTIPANKGAKVHKDSEISINCLKMDLEDLQDEGKAEDIITIVKNTSLNTQDIYLVRVGNPERLKAIKAERAAKLAERQKRRELKRLAEETERDLTRVSGLSPEAREIRRKLENDKHDLPSVATRH